MVLNVLELCNWWVAYTYTSPVSLMPKPCSAKPNLKGFLQCRSSQSLLCAAGLTGLQGEKTVHCSSLFVSLSYFWGGRILRDQRSVERILRNIAQGICILIKNREEENNFRNHSNGFSETHKVRKSDV